MSNYSNTKGRNWRRGHSAIVRWIVQCALVCIFFSAHFSCIDDGGPFIITPPPISRLLLQAEDVGVTDVQIRLRSMDSAALGKVILICDTITGVSVTTHKRDTTVLVENLLPKKLYTYKAYRMEGSARMDSSPPLTITTMDTTSHNYVWTFDTLGSGGNPSYLTDVAIINDTLAYAVGNIEILDSTNNFIIYNLAVWNGLTWKIQRVIMPGYNYDCTIAEYYAPTLRAIFQFPNGKIVIISGAGTAVLVSDTGFIHYPCYRYGLRNGTILRIWGTSENDFYAVGRGGTIGHFQNGVWKKLESGTSFDINDIWGATTKTGELEILACTGVKGGNQGKHILRIRGDSVKVITRNEISHQISGIWFIPDKKYFIVGGTIFSKTNPDDSTRWYSDLAQRYVHYYSNGIRGRGLHDIMIVCDYGEVLHYNGYSWKNLSSQTQLESGLYYTVAMNEKLVIIVGRIGYQAVIATGRR